MPLEGLQAPHVEHVAAGKDSLRRQPKVLEAYAAHILRVLSFLAKLLDLLPLRSRKGWRRCRYYTHTLRQCQFLLVLVQLHLLTGQLLQLLDLLALVRKNTDCLLLWLLY